MSPHARRRIPARLLDVDPRVRIEELSAHWPCTEWAFAMIEVLACDDHGGVRQVAAEQLTARRMRDGWGEAEAAAIGALLRACRDRAPGLREAAVRGLGACAEAGTKLARAGEVLSRILAEDPMWRVRREAVRALLAIEPARAAAAEGDPFWRVRAALHSGSGTPGWIRTDDGGIEHDGALDPDPAVVAVEVTRTPERFDDASLVELLRNPHDVLRSAAIHALARRDSVPDAVVLALERYADPRIPYAQEALSRLLSRVHRAPIAEAILAGGTSSERARAWARGELGLEGEGRSGSGSGQRETEEETEGEDGDLGSIDPRRRSRGIEGATDAELRALVADDCDPFVRRDAAIALVRRKDSGAAGILAGSDDPYVRSLARKLAVRRGELDLVPALVASRDPSPMVRAAARDALDRSLELGARCSALLADGLQGVAREARETVLLAAHAQLLRTPTAETLALLDRDLAQAEISADGRATLAATRLAHPLAAAELDAEVHAPRDPVVVRVPARAPVPERRLGRDGPFVSALTVSGAFDPPERAFEIAHERGVNAWYWEPDHPNLSAFVRRHPGRSGFAIVAGSYEADAKTITKDCERALRRLRVDSLAAMLLFWVRSPARLSDEALEALLRLKESGKARGIGFSTHQRELAIDAIERQPWDVVMTRMSAAHTGAERALLPVCRARGVSVIAFSALAYGRMLRDPVTGESIRPSEAYRYCTSQPAVATCLSAPRRTSEIVENVEAARNPTLDDARLDALRVHGARIYAAKRGDG